MPKPYASAVIAASADEVWSYVRDFANIAEWHPTIEMCEIEGGGPAAVGSVRRLTSGGAEFRERLLALSDVDRYATYTFVESPFPVRAYTSTYQVSPVTVGGGTFVAWWARFEAEAKDEEAMTKIFAEVVFGSGLASLAERFASPGMPETP